MIDIHKIIQTTKALSGFISESVLDEEDLQSDKKKRRRVTWLSLVLTIILLTDIPGIAFSNVKLMLMPPPREHEKAMSKDRWVDFLERRITVSLNKIDELEALLEKAQNDLVLSEENRAELEERVEALSKELNALKRLSEDNREGRLYDRLQKSRER